MKTIMFIVGATLGVLLVRELYFSPINHIAWDMFWSAIMRGEGQYLDPAVMLESETFRISSAGFITGGVFGALAGAAFQGMEAFMNEEAVDKGVTPSPAITDDGNTDAAEPDISKAPGIK